MTKAARPQEGLQTMRSVLRSRAADHGADRGDASLRKGPAVAVAGTAKLYHHPAFERDGSTRQWKIRIQADSSGFLAGREEIPRHNPAGAIGSNQKVATFRMAVEIDLHMAVYLRNRPNRTSILKLSTGFSRSQTQRLIEPITPDHGGHRLP